MNKAAKIMKQRRYAAKLYDQKLVDLDWIQLPFKHPDFVHGYQSYVCLLKPEEPTLSNWEKLYTLRNEIMANLESKGITTRQGTHSAAHVDYYKDKYDIRIEDYPNSFLAEKLSITLPLYAGMNEQEVEKVVMELKSEFDKNY